MYACRRREKTLKAAKKKRRCTECLGAAITFIKKKEKKKKKKGKGRLGCHLEKKKNEDAGRGKGSGSGRWSNLPMGQGKERRGVDHVTGGSSLGSGERNDFRGRRG